MADFTINIAEYVNQPPDVLGDNELTKVDSGDLVTLTSADFTTNTTPAAHDPEGDAFKAIKVVSIETGVDVVFNGNDVNIGDEVLLTDIDAGTFTIGNCTSCTKKLEFKLSDVGSNNFSIETGNIIYQG